MLNDYNPFFKYLEILFSQPTELNLHLSFFNKNEDFVEIYMLLYVVVPSYNIIMTVWFRWKGSFQIQHSNIHLYFCICTVYMNSRLGDSY